MLSSAANIFGPALVSVALVGIVSFWGSGGLGADGPEAGSDNGLLNRSGARSGVETIAECAIVVAGGFTAALFAALTAAREGARTCLLEPTNWPGGQLTASAVSAVDFAWHKVGTLDVAALGKDPRNIPKEFQRWMVALGNPGGCWVSRNCFEPKSILIDDINAALVRQPGLKVFLNTVVKSVVTENRSGVTVVTELEAIQRRPHRWAF